MAHTALARWGEAQWWQAHFWKKERERENCSERFAFHSIPSNREGAAAATGAAAAVRCGGARGAGALWKERESEKERKIQNLNCVFRANSPTHRGAGAGVRCTAAAGARDGEDLRGIFLFLLIRRLNNKNAETVWAAEQHSQ